jgi:tetratricopeptide (TPR) repeat protein
MYRLIPSGRQCLRLRLRPVPVSVSSVKSLSTSSSSSLGPTAAKRSPLAAAAAVETEYKCKSKSAAPTYRMFSGCGGNGGCGSKEPKERFPMPDRDEELKLAGIQTRITESYQEGDFTKALSISQDLLKQTEAHFGRDHPATASAYNNIGLMQKLLGDFIEARKHYNHAMRIYGKVVGRDHASYAMTLHNLGALNKSQVHFDASLKATDRLSLMETALEYFEEAWAIRKAELGDEHPHTVATKSSYGTTLATQILHQHKYVESGKTKQYVLLNASNSVTHQGWEAAEAHLREALETAIQNPRGRSIHKSGGGKRKKNNNNNKGKPQPPETGMHTLSAAAAAQNLAVFLKSRAMTEDPYHPDMMKEAQQLYKDIQTVRSQLLPKQHPDLYATKYSLAELLETIGDEEAANALRQEIIDTYDPLSQGDAMPEPEKAAAAEEEEESSSPPRRQVVVEQTMASKN